ncbi:GNAT family N-acetyltransferase [Nonomuraea deserti]|uniref:GNAT family N-acetyltransferase n=1 Tax=Nonomuraea deserti TaxID=1848322 RepID=A0A4V2YCK1_9ACTN|nr:GNAT family N-acetyltransferase [Nonomuraea deserti]TDD11766.1 GNAT family N-acetyltransferase [Nonomuraea deserti]
MSGGFASPEPLPGYLFRPCAGGDDHGAMAAVRRGCAARDRIDARSVVEGLPTAAEIADSCAALTSASDNQVLVEHDGDVVGYTSITWWEEQDGTWLYLHRGHLLPGHRGRGVGSAMLDWAETRIRRLVREHGTTRTAVFGANATAHELEATALLLDAGYRRVFSLVELDLPDLRHLPGGRRVPGGIRLGAVGPDSFHAAWRTVVDAYADADFTERWTFEGFLATADPACWRGAWAGDRMVGVALCSVRRRDQAAVGEVEELSVRAGSRRQGLGRALLLDGLRCLREHGAETARLYTGTSNPYRSYDLYESAGFRRQTEHVRYRKPIDHLPGSGQPREVRR